MRESEVRKNKEERVYCLRKSRNGKDFRLEESAVEFLQKIGEVLME